MQDAGFCFIIHSRRISLENYYINFIELKLIPTGKTWLFWLVKLGIKVMLPGLVISKYASAL
jgi:hypothetical protein